MVRCIFVATFGWAATSLVLYLLGSFVAASFNILHWLPEGRFMVATMIMIAGIVCGALAFNPSRRWP